ncbi:uroporphyrinogen-III C-methyltransferase [Diaphorobacter aerolatus]|uniref:uroporphyrinogen-III C-methyltransferase n=1 Tax=Diaphorobacter aerolatus TaxID=1288495 RepID=A0A7H0GGB9_9BURK|nr:uroporphyrinogen-III C-methyltransferase [Diaphorobacter aerolatus]QNP47335.1 uroporphyrinogen-III C-methyltransferase [Diaphorobacter aerolatus]
MNASLQSSMKSCGRCYLVGAGPGDPELLTIKACNALRSATVVLVDDLVSPEIVALAPSNARVIHVGKRGGRLSTPQGFIERLMLLALREGETVVRLKGGDPFIFGRGGEEAEHLRAAGVHVEVINGITSGLAAPASLGIALTHRDHAQGVMLITGHARKDRAAVNWSEIGRAAARCRTTLVIYMGVSSCGEIEAGLLDGGLDAQTPVALISHASLPAQHYVITQLSRLGAALNEAGLASPCIFVVGDVVRTRDPAALPIGEEAAAFLRQHQQTISLTA